MAKYNIGQRVRITEDCRKEKTATGKMGHYVGDANGWIPILKLDDGDVIYGCECWWESIDDENSMQPLEESQSGLEVLKSFYRKALFGESEDSGDAKTN